MCLLWERLKNTISELLAQVFSKARQLGNSDMKCRVINIVHDMTATKWRWWQRKRTVHFLSTPMRWWLQWVYDSIKTLNHANIISTTMFMTCSCTYTYINELKCSRAFSPKEWMRSMKFVPNHILFYLLNDFIIGPNYFGKKLFHDKSYTCARFLNERRTFDGC